MLSSLFRKLFSPRKRDKNFIYTMANLPRVETQDAARSFTRLFATDDGKKVLSYLQTTTFQRALGPDSTDAHVRYIEGQRALMATILRMIDRGAQGG